MSGAKNGAEVKYRYDDSITYAGYQYDAESGLYYLNARYYDSTTARFLTEDTYGGSADDPLSLNRYTYCANNPLRYTDPSGHFWGVIITILVNVVKDAAISAGIELAVQIYIARPEDIDAKEVAFEAVVGGATTFIGGVYGVTRKATKTLNTVRKVQKAARTVKIANNAFRSKARAKEVPGGFVEDLAHQFFVEGKSLDELDLGQALQAAAVSGIMGSNDKLMDGLLPKKQPGAKGKKNSQTTGLIADAADGGPRPKVDVLPEGKVKGNVGSEGKANATVGNHAGGDALAWGAKKQKVSGTTDSVAGISKNQQKIQGQTVDGAFSKNKSTKAGKTFASTGSDVVTSKLGETGVRKGQKGLIGSQFEEYLTNTLVGNGSFKLGGREFDGNVNNRF